jgi:hypothetical protein
MIFRRSPLVALAALVLAACAGSPVDVPPAARLDAFATASAATPQFSAQRLSDHIKYLASDELEGRGCNPSIWSGLRLSARRRPPGPAPTALAMS